MEFAGSPDVWAVIAVLLGGGFASHIVGVWRAGADKRKVEAERDSIIADASTKAVGLVRSELVRMEVELNEARAHMSRLAVDLREAQDTTKHLRGEVEALRGEVIHWREKYAELLETYTNLKIRYERLEAELERRQGAE